MTVEAGKKGELSYEVSVDETSVSNAEVREEYFLPLGEKNGLG